MKHIITALDIGNSSINIGYYTDNDLIVQKIRTHPRGNIDEYSDRIGDFLSKNDVEKCSFSVIISSVVSGYAAVFKGVFERLSQGNTSEFIVVDHTVKTGLRFKIDRPEEAGADRIANAVAAYGMYKAEVAVIDFGTATTVTVVDRNAHYLGGSIAPGLGLMNEVLEKGTAKISKVLLETPSSALGKHTDGCILSGIFFGSAGAVERILNEIEKERKCSFHAVLTGGYAKMMDQYITRPHDTMPHLTLEGLRILYEKNRTA